MSFLRKSREKKIRDPGQPLRKYTHCKEKQVKRRLWRRQGHGWQNKQGREGRHERCPRKGVGAKTCRSTMVLEIKYLVVSSDWLLSYYIIIKIITANVYKNHGEKNWFWSNVYYCWCCMFSHTKKRRYLLFYLSSA